MNPGKFDLDMYRGDSYSWRFRLWKDEAKTIPVDLTGATVASEIRNVPGGTEVLPLLSLITLPNIVDLSMEPDMYVDCPTTGVWDLQITFPDGQVQTPIGGTTKITADVTDSLSLGVMIVPMTTKTRLRV